MCTAASQPWREACQFPLRIHPAFFALAIVFTIHAAKAQDPPRYAEYREDSTFRMGGHGVIPRKAASELRLDYIYLYNGNPTQFRGFAGATSWTGSPGNRDSLLWDNFKDSTYQIAYNLPPGHDPIYPAEGQVGNANAFDSYPSVDLSKMQAFNFDSLDPSGVIDDADEFGLVRTVTVWSDPVPSDRKMAWRPTYVSTYGLSQVGLLPYTAAGITVTDSVDRVRVSFTFLADSLDIEALHIGDDDAIAYAKIYRRVELVPPLDGRDLVRDRTEKARTVAHPPIRSERGFFLPRLV